MASSGRRRARDLSQRDASGGVSRPGIDAARPPVRLTAMERSVRVWSVVAAALAVPATLIASACSSDDGAEPPGADAPPSGAGLVGPAEFAARIGEPDVVTVNVHVPDEGSIAGTDLTVPFDEIARSSALPDDRDTPLAVYCRSGSMSADAVRELAALGYTDVVELEGGFNAWIEADRPLEPFPNS